METSSYKNLKPGHCLVASFPRIESMLSGVVEMRQNKAGDIRLVYEDGSDEIANCPEIDLGGDYRALDVVSAVQAKRK